MAGTPRVANCLNPTRPVFAPADQKFTYDSLDYILNKARNVVRTKTRCDVTFIFFGHLYEPKVPGGIDAENYLLFQFKEGQSIVPIDILSVISNGKLKTYNKIVEELASKVSRFCVYSSRPDYHMNLTGAWLDLSNTSPYKVNFDSDFKLTINGTRVFSEYTRSFIMKHLMHTSTVIRFIPMGNRMWIIDREVLCETKRGYCVELEKQVGVIAHSKTYFAYILKQIDLNNEMYYILLNAVEKLE